MSEGTVWLYNYYCSIISTQRLAIPNKHISEYHTSISVYHYATSMCVSIHHSLLVFIAGLNIWNKTINNNINTMYHLCICIRLKKPIQGLKIDMYVCNCDNIGLISSKYQYSSSSNFVCNCIPLMFTYNEVQHYIPTLCS